MAFNERIWISSPGPTSTVPREPSPRWSSTVATASGAGAAVVAGAGAAVVAAAAAGAAVVAAGAASSASSEPQAPAISEKPKSSASGTRAHRNIVIFLHLANTGPCRQFGNRFGGPRPPAHHAKREWDVCHMNLPYRPIRHLFVMRPGPPVSREESSQGQAGEQYDYPRHRPCISPADDPS